MTAAAIQVRAIEDGFVRFAHAWNRRLIALPVDARCRDCDATNPMILRRNQTKSGTPSKVARCYRCRKMRHGYSGIERHHIGRRPSPFEPIGINSNMHRILNYLQHVWSDAGIRPGSLDAVLFDLATLFIVALRWEQP